MILPPQAGLILYSIRGIMDQIEVLEQSENFEDIEGEYKFLNTLVVYRQGRHLFHALSNSRSTTGINVNDLTDKIHIPLTVYCPPFPSNFTRAPASLSRSYYIKRPRLSSYDRVRDSSNPNQISERVLGEVEVCETLKRRPHPNVTQYLGCQVDGDRITAICFPRYDVR